MESKDSIQLFLFNKKVNIKIYKISTRGDVEVILSPHYLILEIFG